MKKFLAIILCLFVVLQTVVRPAAVGSEVGTVRSLRDRLASIELERQNLPLLRKLNSLRFQLPKRITEWDNNYAGSVEAFFYDIRRKIPLVETVYSDYPKTLTDFYALYQSNLEKQANWSHGIFPSADNKLFNPFESSFTPFVQKVVVPEASDIVFLGDLHGGYHSSMAIINKLHEQGKIDVDFKIVDPNLYMVFLGDFVDRGLYGVEVIYMLMKLKLANPDRVFLVRGNHEDINQNIYEYKSNFITELKAKLDNTISVENYAPAWPMTNGFYNLLPVALYIGKGNDFIQCCHGGIDMAYNPEQFLALGSEVKDADEKEQSRDACFELLTEKNYNLVNTTSKLGVETATEIAKAALIESGGTIRSDDDIAVLQRQICDFVNKYGKHIKEQRQTLAWFTEALESDETKNTVDEVSLVALNKAIEELRDALFNSEKFHNFCLEFQSIHEEINQKIDGLIERARQHNKALQPGLIEKYSKFDSRSYQEFIKDQENMSVVYQAFDEELMRESIIHRLLLQEIDQASSDRVNRLAKEQAFYFLMNVGGVPKSLGEIGLVWADFSVDKNTVINFELTGRPCFGCDLTRDVLQLHNIRAVFRGHQHYGEMLELLKEHQGITALWDYDNADKVIRMQQGLVCTFQRAQSALEFEFNCHAQDGSNYPLDYDTYGLLHIEGPFEAWTLTKNHVRDEQRLMREEQHDHHGHSHHPHDQQGAHEPRSFAGQNMTVLSLLLFGLRATPNS